MSEHDPLALLNMLGSRLPAEMAFEVSADNELPEEHPLYGEVQAALSRTTASLPYVRKQDVLWVTLAPNAEALRRAIEDLRCWLLPSYGWEATPAVVADAGSGGQMGTLLLEQSPNGYFRWFSRRGDLGAVIERLAMMRDVISRAPARESQLRPTLETLRRQFALALATGDHDLALRAVDEIDQRQLDSASNSLGMRIRLAATFGDDQAIVSHPLLDNLLSMQLPRRVVEGVLRAHHAVFLADFEASGDLDSALDAYRRIADRLEGLAASPEHGADPLLVSMASYQAAIDEDAAGLNSLAVGFPNNAVTVALAEMLVVDPSTTEPSEAEAITVSQTPPVDQEIARAEEAAGAVGSPALLIPIAISDWAEMPAALSAGESERLNAFLAEVALDPDGCDPVAGDFMFEIFTDDAILADPERALEADQILTAVIDAYICEERFPRRERLLFYQAVLDVWSSSRAQSTDPVDGQLLLTISDALLRLDGQLESVVAVAITRWWEARAVRSRLAWLGEALERLTDESNSQDHLVLWYDGANLIRLDAEALSFTDRDLWFRLGRRLGLGIAATEEALGGPAPVLGLVSDPLQVSGFSKIAIVSLHERAAREAAAQIEARTNANVIVVTDHAAGEGTASAATADVILFVWGATKHAVYRAFDKVRDRLEYVQGTGSASIVRALERRAQAGINLEPTI